MRECTCCILSFILQVTWNRKNPYKLLSLSGVQRERAEAGVLLLNVRLAQKAKHGIAVKRERTRQFPLPPNKIALALAIGYFILHVLQQLRTPARRMPCHRGSADLRTDVSPDSEET